MPKRRMDDETPRRTGKGPTVVAPGWVMRAVMYSPKDFVAGTVAFAAICTIVGNAIFMQTGRHPSPMFGTPSFSEVSAPMVANPLPRPRPLEAVQASEKTLDSRLFDSKPAEVRVAPKPVPVPEPRVEVRPEPKAAPRVERAEPRVADPMSGLIRNAAVAKPVVMSQSSVPRPPASVPNASDPLGDLISGSGRRTAR